MEESGDTERKPPMRKSKSSPALNVAGQNRNGKISTAETIDEKFQSEFDIVLKYVPKRLTFRYLEKILEFLKSNKTELCWLSVGSEAAPFIEDFLVKIVDDKENLRSSRIRPPSREIATQILSVLEENKDTFKLIYKYELGKTARNVLVYKKFFLIKPSEVMSNNSTTLLASSLETMSLPLDRQEVPASFRISALNTTLRFLKDSTRLTHQYPEMSLKHAHFLHTLLSQGNHGNEDIGFGFKSIYSPLFQCMLGLKSEYEFRVSISDADEVFNTARILLEKKPKLNISDNVSQKKESRKKLEKKPKVNSPDQETDKTTENPEQHKESENLSTPTLSTASASNQQTLPEDYIKNTLHQIVEMVEDEQQASLIMEKLDNQRIGFLKQITTLTKIPDSNQFGEDCVPLLKRIVESYKQDMWNITLDVGKPCKTTGRRSVSLQKQPKFTTKSGKTRCVPTQTRFSKAQQLDGSPDKVGEKSPPHNAIAFQTAGTMVLTDNDVTEKGGGEPAAGSGGRVRLLQGLATPLAGNVGERLMRQMGWAGGALGLRAGGLLEPLQPALHIKPGVGLGHVNPANPANPAKQAKTAKAEFRKFLLDNILTFLRSPDVEYAVSFPRPISDKERKFIPALLKAMNKRVMSGVSLSAPAEAQLLKQICVEMMKDMQFYVDYTPGDRRTLRLIKIKSNAVAPKISKISKAAASQQSKDPSEDLSDLQVITKYYDLENICSTSKAANSLAYRILFLINIKNFLTMDVSEEAFKIGCIIKKKQKKYLESIILDINKKTFQAKLSEIENKIYKEIKKMCTSGGNFHLSVAFCGQKFILKKMQYTKPTTNSTPPILKSKDVKNTIIYTKDGILKPSDLEKGDGIEKNNDENAGSSDEQLMMMINQRQICEDDLIDTDMEDSKDSINTSNNCSLLDVIEKKACQEEVNNNCSVRKNQEKEYIFDTKEGSSLENLSDGTMGRNRVEIDEEYSKYIAVIAGDGQNITLDLVKEVQTLISNIFEDTPFLPRVKCHGVKDGRLIYSCHDEKTYGWLKNAISVASVKITDTDFRDKLKRMCLKLNSFVKEDSETVFNRMEMYYPSLNTKNWAVKCEKRFENCVFYSVELEEKDFQFVCDNNFALYAGVDKVEFSIDWD